MTPELIAQRLGERCWRKIGVHGDRSCPELATVVHCRNCPVFGAAGRELADRAPPPGYLTEQSAVIATVPVRQSALDRSVLLFRLGREWLAIDTAAVTEVVADRTVHRIAHRTRGVLLGLVNIRGQLRLCVSLRGLLTIAAPPAPGTAAAAGAALDQPSQPGTRDAPRMIVIRKGADVWVFPADEVFNVHRFRSGEVETVPMTVSAAVDSHSRGVFDWHDHKVGYLAVDAIFETLRRMMG